MYDIKTISVKEASEIKVCARQTIYNNITEFDIIGKQIIDNEKFRDWSKSQTQGKNKKSTPELIQQ